MRATLISQLAYQVAFSFEPEGLIYISGHRYIGGGKMKLQYFRFNEFYEENYGIENAREKIVYLHEPKGDNMCLAKQPELTVFEVEIGKREILLEKHGAAVKKEIRRIEDDPLYMMLYYCEIRPVR